APSGATRLPSPAPCPIDTIVAGGSDAWVVDTRLLLACALQNQFAAACGIRLPLHRLHNRTDNRTSGLHLAVADLLQNVRLRGQSFIDCGDQCAIVRHDREPACVDDLLRGTFASDNA